MNEYTLVLLAAGKGSRFGGLKQLHPFEPQGATLTEFALWDAWQHGFRNFVAVVNEETKEGFQEIFKKCGLEDRSKCILQEQNDSKTKQFSRQKPWGTAHALYSVRQHVHTPFVIINADDFYGRDAYHYAAQFLQTHKEDYALVGYPLGKTLSPNGSVSRAVCALNERNYVAHLREYGHIEERNGEIIGKFNNQFHILNPNTFVSLNFWILQTSIFKPLEQKWSTFLEQLTDPKKDEFYLPVAIQSIAQDLGLNIHCLPNLNGRWLGVTYAQDTAFVQNALIELNQEKHYPAQFKEVNA